MVQFVVTVQLVRISLDPQRVWNVLSTHLVFLEAIHLMIVSVMKVTQVQMEVSVFRVLLVHTSQTQETRRA